MTVWTIKQELSMKRPCTPQRMLWVVRKDGRVVGKRHRSQGKAERFVSKLKGVVMAEWTGTKLDGIEARCVALGEISRDTVLSQRVTTDLAADTLDVIAELRRLQAMEERLKSLMAFKRKQIAEDRRVAAEQGVSWLGVNSRTISANMLDGELQNLEKVLGHGTE